MKKLEGELGRLPPEVPVKFLQLLLDRSEAGRNFAASVIFLRTDCVARNLYDQSILVDQPAQVTAARELWLAQGGRLPIPFCGSLAKTLLPGGTTQNPYAQTHSGIRAQRAHEHHQ